MRGTRIWLGLIAVLALAGSAHAQPWAGGAGVTVEVLDHKKKPVPGARVQVLFVDVEPYLGPPPTTTDGSGKATFTGLTEGRWRVDVNSEGHAHFFALVRLDSGKKAPLIVAGPIRDGAEAPLRLKFAKATGYTPPAAPRRAKRAQTDAGAPPVAPPRATTDQKRKAEKKRGAKPKSGVRGTGPDSTPPVERPSVRPEPAPRPAPPSTPPEPEPEPDPQPSRPMPEPAAETSKPMTEPVPQAPEPATSEPMPEPEPTRAEVAPPTVKPAEPAPTAKPPVPEPSAPVVEAEPVSPPSAPVPQPKPTAAEEPVTEKAMPETAPPSGGELANKPAEVVPSPSPRLQTRPIPPRPKADPPPVPKPAPAPVAETPEPSAPEMEEPKPEEPPTEESRPPAPAPSAPADLPAPETSAPAPAPAAPAVPPGRRLGARSSLRAADRGTCPDCKPGEEAFSIEQVVAPGARLASGAVECAEGSAERVSRAADLVARAGVTAPTPLVDPSTGAPGANLGAAAAEIAELVVPYSDGTKSCQVLALWLPEGAKFKGYAYEVRDASGTVGCIADQECALGEGAFIGHPRIDRNAGGTLVSAIFDNWSGSEERVAKLTVYFAR